MHAPHCPLPHGGAGRLAGAADPLQLHARDRAASRVLIEVLRRFGGGPHPAADALPHGILTTLLERAVGATRLEYAPGRLGGGMGLDLYLALGSGIYEYDPTCGRLYLLSALDIRARIATLDRLPPAPVNLIYVGTTARCAPMREQDAALLAALNTASLCEAVDRFCAGAGLAAAVRGLLEREALGSSLDLRQDQHLLLVQSIGRSGAGTRIV